ncbi:MAG: DUF3990 domain-containing protein [Thomasclavelia sp.]
MKMLHRKTGVATVSCYELDEKNMSKLSILRFNYADKNWLKYVVENRRGTYTGKKYDLVIGPVANDNTMPVIKNYMTGIIDENTALILLKPQKLTDQYAFLTFKGIQALNLVEVNQYGK